MFDEAIKELNKAVKYDFSNKDALVNLGTALQGKGLYAEAVEMFKKALNLAASEHEKGIIYYNLGNAYKEQESFEEAIPFYLKAIEIDSERDNRHFNLGQCYLALMRLDDAIVEYEAALRINPSHELAKTSLEAARMVRDSDMAEELYRTVKSSRKEHYLDSVQTDDREDVHIEGNAKDYEQKKLSNIDIFLIIFVLFIIFLLLQS